jgi:hypothetical protein
MDKFLNPLIYKSLLGVGRHLLGALGALLIEHGWATDSEAQMLLGLAPVLAAIGMSVWNARHNEQKLGAALLPGVTTKEEASALAKLPNAPPASLPNDVSARAVSPLTVQAI